MEKLSEISTPAIAGVIRGKNALSATAEIKKCMYDGADMIDLYLSCLEKNDVSTLRTIVNSSKLPI